MIGKMLKMFKKTKKLKSVQNARRSIVENFDTYLFFGRKGSKNYFFANGKEMDILEIIMLHADDNENIRNTIIKVAANLALDDFNKEILQRGAVKNKA